MNQLTTYIGTKIIQATPMPGPHGVLYPDQPGYQVVYEDGYTSWSPKDVFERAYSKIDAMTFGDALLMLKAGKRVARAGWNGKGMWLRLLQPYAPHPDTISGKSPSAYLNPYFKAADNNEHAEGTMLPWIGMKTADNGFVPWLASQTDMLAEDWQVVE